jgi:osmoprotectant transport system permease protein
MEETLAIRKLDRLGMVLVAGGVIATALLPFIYVKANRIASGKPMLLLQLVNQPCVIVLTLLLILTAFATLFSRNAIARLTIATLCLAALIIAIGLVSTAATPPNSNAARMTPGGGFWVLFAVTGLIISDALVKIRLTPWMRVASLAAYTGLLAICLSSGLLDSLSIMKEFATRADQFWSEAVSHLLLALGSLAVAIVIGLPLGIFCFWVPKLRAAVLQGLSLIQTVPSLGYLATHVPLAAEIGIRGIGTAPALIALILYSLLPIVANTVVGLEGVDPSVRDAAAGMGLTRRQILTGIDLPLAFPVILTGIRIVLVQAIGMVTIAALIGGGGFGIFIFQGLGQTAILDAVIDSIRETAT